MNQNLTAAITRGMRSIESMRPAIGLDGYTEAEREGIEMLTWMSWQPLEQFPSAVQEAFPRLASLGLVELRAIAPGAPVTMVRLKVALTGGAS